MNFIKSIRQVLANAIAPTNHSITIDTQGARDLIIPQAPTHILTQEERSKKETAKYPGKIKISQIVDLNSTYLKNALLQLGAWSALARSFAEYERIVGKRGVSDQKLGALLEEFHAFNAATDVDKQMNDESVIITADRLSKVQAQKGTPETDAIIARIRKCSIDDLRKQREADAAKASAKRESMLEGFITQVWSFKGNDLDPALDGTKAVGKALQTMDFIARSWTGNPASIAAELLLIEHDMKVLEKISAEDLDANPDAHFINGTLTADGMMNQEELERKIGDVRPDITPKARDMVRRIRRAEIERDMQAYQEADHIDDEQLDTDAERAA